MSRPDLQEPSGIKADVDGDGVVDVLIPANEITRRGFQLLRGKSTGGFEESQTAAGETRHATGTLLKDIDGDDVLDLVYLASEPNNRLKVVMQKGDGHGKFVPARVEPDILSGTSRGTSEYLWAASLDAVPGSEVVTRFAENSDVSPNTYVGRWSNGALTLTKMDAPTIPIFGAADLRGTGRDQLLVYDKRSLLAYSLEGNRLVPKALGEPGPGLLYPLGVYDLNGDGRGEVIFWGSPVVVMVNSAGGGKLRRVVSAETLFVLRESILVEDVDGDGVSDLLGDSSGGQQLALARGKPNLTFAPARAIRTTGEAIFPIDVKDVDGDSRPDIITRTSLFSEPKFEVISGTCAALQLQPN